MQAGQKSVVVLGGTGSIGRAICLALAKTGHDIHFTYGQRVDVAKDLVENIEKLGQKASYEKVSLGTAKSMASLASSVSEMRGLCGAVYASGPDLEQPFISQVEASKWSEIFQKDTLSFLEFAHIVLPKLRAEKGGSLLAVTTAATIRHADRDGLSTIPKAAVEAAIRGIAREEGRYGIRANCVAPGMLEEGLGQRILTNHFNQEIASRIKAAIPLRCFGAADDIAQAAAFFMSSSARYVTGQTLRVDGGWSA